MCRLKRNEKCIHTVRNVSGRLQFGQWMQNIIDAVPGRIMRAIGRGHRLSETIIHNMVEQDIQYNSYLMRNGQFMPAHTRKKNGCSEQKDCWTSWNIKKNRHALSFFFFFFLLSIFCFSEEKIRPRWKSEPEKSVYVRILLCHLY